MEPNLHSAVRSVVRLTTQADGTRSAETLYGGKDSTRKRKSHPALAPHEKLARRLAEAHQEASRSFLERHDKSSRKRKNGWATDLPINVLKASLKGQKALRLTSLAPQPKF